MHLFRLLIFWLLAAVSLMPRTALAQSYAASSTTYSWLSTSGHTPVVWTGAAGGPAPACTGGSAATDDDISEELAIGFSFTFGSTAYTTVRIMSNGRLQFSNTYCGNSTGVNIPNASVVRTMRIYGEDLDSSASGSVTYKSIGSAPNRQFVVTWTNVPEWNRPSSKFNLQMILNEDGSFVYQYGSASGYSSASRQVGWELTTTDYKVHGTSAIASLVNTAIRWARPNSTLSGTVFEDVNYGGGAGRSMASASGSGRSGATVELYNSSGVFVSSTTTASGGTYSFTVSTSGTYYVRVASPTVTSSRSGSSASLRSVLTYRTTAASGSAVAVTDHVGGTNPGATDPGTASSGATFNTSTFVYSAGLSGTAQAVTPAVVTLGTNISGLDFGFNFNTVANTNDSGAGSLRQAITNANTLGGDASLAQAGRSAGVEHLVFMIGNGTAAAGLRGTVSYVSGGVATIAVASALPAITQRLTIDGTTQPGWSSTPVVELNGAATAAGIAGLVVSASDSTIKGLAINRFGGNGITLGAGTSGQVVSANHIGTNAAGTAASANGGHGVDVRSDTTTVGGTAAGAGNLLSGNAGSGVYVGASSVTIVGNRIGTNAAGTGAVANQYGVRAASSASLVIGGTTAAAANTISGNTSYGIYFESANSSATVQGNRIGRNAADSGALGNGGHGVYVSGSGGGGLSSGTLGGTVTGSGNVIAHNGSSGVVLATGAGTQLAILRNSIHSHAGPGIDLGADGISANDGSSSGGQPNRGMDAPVISTASVSGTSLTLSGWVGSAAGQSTFGGARVDVYVSDNSLASGSGQTWVGTLTADSSGNVSGTVTVPSGVTLTYGSTRLTATATDSSGNTSEFGANLLLGFTLSGTVFEDLNYGGGAGRTRTAASGVGIAGARLELYGSSGSFVTSTTSGSGGSYSFTGLAAGSWRVRLVTGSTPSSRSGWTSTAMPVLTFRTDASTGTAVAVTDHVGGINPATADAGNAASGSTLNTSTGVFSAGISGTAQALAPAVVGSADIGGIDFGVNFSTIVNTLASGQGSLHQAIANANTLGGDSSLAQAGRTAGIEHLVFMIANGSSAAGLRSSLDYTSGGVATITPTAALPTLTAPLVIDARTQPGWSSAPVVELNGASAGSGVHGLTLSATGCTVGGLTINRFNGSGIRVEGGSGSHTVVGNWIGLNSAGTAASANGAEGLSIGVGTGNVIGGLTSAERNVMSGNGNNGMTLMTGGNLIRGNYVGTNAAGSGRVANGSVGIYLAGSGNTIGGTTAGAGNVISGNTWEQLQLDTTSTGNTVQGNLIGPTAAGALTIANAGYGIWVKSSGNTVGGTTPAAANTIAGNGNKGVVISGSASSGNAILGNVIRGNSGIAIDLGNDGSTANDGATTANQPNLLMDAPVLSSATYSGSTLTLSGYVGSAAGQATFAGARVEIFIADTSVPGTTQAQSYLGFLTTDSSGNFSGTLSVPSGITPGSTALVATATDTSNNTSEFSAGATVAHPGALSGTVFEDLNYGGGAGRSLATSGGAAVNGARVELYDGSGAFVADTTSSATGSYSFSGLAAGTYHVRVVSSSVLSTRSGASSAQLGVLTYRTTASSGSAVAVTDAVGGTNPAAADPGNGSSGTTLNTSTYAFSAGLSGTAHAVAPVTVGTSTVSGVDFGFNFSTVVNTHASGAGSLAQVVANANALGGDATLAVSGRTAGIEHVVFMIGNGSSAAGLRSSVDLFSGGVATITPGATISVSSALVIDAQTQPGWTDRPLVQLVGTGSASGSSGLAITAGGSTVRGLILNRWPASGLSLSTAGGNTVQGNWVGLDSTGAAASANGSAGISVSSNSNTLGGTGANEGNVVSGNSGAGVLVNTGSTGTVIVGNRIGTNAAGSAGVGNAQEGVTVQGSATLGGVATGAGNTIAYNTGNGVSVRGAVTGTIRGNAIFGNSSRGIDLGNDGLTTNDGAKTTGQPNLRMDMPVVLQALLGSSTLTVTGYVGSAVSQTTFGSALVDIYVSDGDATGYGEGQTYVGTVTADSSGWFTGTLSTSGLSGLVAGSTRITATATDASGNTSEFAANRTTAALAALANAGFELPTSPGPFTTYAGGLTTIPGWITRRGGVDHIGTYWTAAEGSNSVDMSGGSAGGLQQTVLTVPGQTYTLAFMMATNTACGTSTKVLAVSAAGSSGSYSLSTSGRSTTAMGWQDQTLVFTASSEATTLIFDSQENSACGPALDHVRLLTGALYSISGTVFEDRNYGGGAGRSLAASSGSTVNGARVELYDSAGAYVTNTSTAGSGSYSFANLPAGSYHVRVVSSSVLSTRSGTTASLRSVLTFRTSAASGSAVAVTDHVGGTAPGSADPGNASGVTVLNTSSYAFSSGLSGTAQAIAPVTIGSASVSGVDFGFNFNTVVNTNDSGAGSLRQAITNANTLGSDSTLAQAGRTAGVEHIVFMIANGSAAAGLRSSLNYTSGGVATIAPSSALPTLTTTLVLDARTQPGWTSAPVIELNGTSAGASSSGLTLTCNNSTVAGFTINRFGGSGIYLNVAGGNTLAANWIGSNNAGTAASPNTGAGVRLNAAFNTTIGGTSTAAANVIRGNGGKGVVITSSTSIGNAILGNAIYGNTSLGIDLADNGASANDGAKTLLQPNVLMDAPVVTTATLQGSNLTLNGYVGSAAGQSTFANVRVEFFIAATLAGAGDQSQTYLGTLTTDASGNFSGTLTGVSGLTAGSSRVIATATDSSNNTSEFGASTVVYNAVTVSGKVFEDLNYGGGAGRSLSASGGVALNGARVELYDSSGAYQTATTTAGGGSYSFAGLVPGTYHVRVVSGTVTSSRSGATAAHLGVLTYRTTATSGSAVAVTNAVGGTNPAAADPGNGSSGTTLNTSSYAFSAGLSGTAHAVAAATVSTGDLTGLDFGFHFTTVVNTNDSGAGSLRQAITNANALGGDTSLASAGRAAAVEHVVFMIANGSSAAGLRSSFNYTSGGVATITPGSALPTVSATLVLDARTQPGWSSAPVIELTGGSAAGAAGVVLNGGSSTVAGFTINRFAGSGLAITGGTAHTVVANWIGSNSAGTAASGNGAEGIKISGSGGNKVGGTDASAANVIRGNGGSGVAVTGITSTGNAILGNAIHGNGGLGIDLGNDGVSANDGLKTLLQPNLMMDAPVITSARARGTALSVSGHVGSAAGQPLFAGARVEVFVADPDGSGFGEGQTLLGTLTADASGNFSGTLTLATPLALGTRLTATATDGSSNTSEFGPTFAGLVVDFVVNHAGDEADDRPGDGLCATSKGNCTLRAAIEEVNALGAQPSQPTIAFDLPACKSPGDAACVIAPTTSLPAVKTTVVIDGSTQPTFDAGSCGPLVELDGSATASGISGLLVAADTVRIQSLVIRRFGGSGITLSDGTRGHEVYGNYIGTDASGTRAEPNAQFGVEWRSKDTTIGGTRTCEANLLSGNQVAGVFIGTRGGQLVGNRIGPTADDRDLLPSKFGVYSVDSSDVTLGGGASEYGNAVAGHYAYGLYFEGSHSGMTVAFNRIYRNSDAGLVISGSSTQVQVTTNSFWDNGGLGIDFGADGPDANSGVLDPSRPNAGMNHPVITGAGIDSAGTSMTLFGYIGTGSGQPAFAGARVEFFKAAVDASGYGEGEVYLGALTADANGQFTGSVSFAAGTVNVGDTITATATDSSGNTSEFGPNWVSTTVAALTPAGFNAFDSGTAPGSLSGNLTTRVGGVPSTVDVIALNSAGSGLHSGFSGTVSLTWMDARNDSGAVSGTCRSSWTALGATGSAGTATFVLAARTTVAVVPPATSTRVMRLKMTHTSALGTTTTACSTDAFAVIPASLTLTATDADAATAGTARALANISPVGGVVHRAGRPFTVTATARDALGNVMTGYDGSPTLAVAGCVLPLGCTAGALTASAASATAGVYSNTSVSYAEVGSITLQLSDTSYAAVDSADTLAALRSISSLATAVGRFVPDAYTLALSTPGQLATANGSCMAAGSGATFFGQGFGWATPPQVNVTAVNAAGATTTLWTGALQTLTAGAASASLATASAGAATLSSSIGSLSLSSLGAGLARLDASSTDRFVLELPGGTQQASTTPTWTWTLTVSDATDAGVAGNPTLSGSVTQAGVAFDQGGVFHSGRLALAPAHGDARLGVRQLVELQRWGSAGWVTMTEDRGCITVQPQHLALAAPSGVFDSGGLCAAPLTAAATTRGGRAWLSLPATPGGAAGRLTTRLSGDSSGSACTSGGALQGVSALGVPWLMGSGSGPVALATWGRANRPAVLRRETW